MNRKLKLTIAIFGPVALTLVAATSPSWQAQTSGTKERLRGVSAVSAAVAWASGNRGVVIRTVDGGETWAAVSVPGAEGLDFRDIEAIDANTAYALSIGPGDRSRIYKTIDGGRSWTLQFTNADPRAFYDAIAFWDADHGLAMGDPVDSRFTVVVTADGGRTWSAIPAAGMPQALPGEGAFAASGTCLVVQGQSHAWFGTGSAVEARVFRSIDRGLTWEVSPVPIAAGRASAGVFSLAFFDPLRGVAVGGDYTKEAEASENLVLTEEGGKTWSRVGGTRLRGFRSAVAFLKDPKGRALLAVGPQGADLSVDGGATWSPFGDQGFHAFDLAIDHDVGWAVGELGRVGKLAPALPR